MNNDERGGSRMDGPLMADDGPECLDGPDGCEGAVEYRMPLSASGRSFPRCEKHWSKRLDDQDEINRKYPTLQPSDFDPLYAGERWDDEY